MISSLWADGLVWAKIREAKQIQKHRFLIYTLARCQMSFAEFWVSFLFSWRNLSGRKEMDLLGYTPLRNKIKRYLESKFELAFSPTSFLWLVAVSKQSFDFTNDSFSWRGIAVESPSFYRLPLFKASGTRLFGIPMDEEGIDLENWKNRSIKINWKQCLSTRIFKTLQEKWWVKTTRKASRIVSTVSASNYWRRCIYGSFISKPRRSPSYTNDWSG